MGIFDIFKIKNEIKVEDKPLRKNIISQIKNNVLYRTKQDIASWRLALSLAEDKNNPNRYSLQTLYKEIENDDEVTTQMEKAYNRVMATDYIVYDAEGNPDEEKTKLFDAAWFEKYCRYVLESKYYGYSLIQFGGIENTKYNKKEVKLVPRYFVIPELGIVQRHIGDNTGIPFDKGIYQPYLIGVGDEDNLGLFNKIAPLYIYKKNAMAFWANYQERFGEPMVAVRTDLTNDKNVKALQGFLDGFSDSSYVIASLDDEISLVESGKFDAYSVFMNMIDMANAGIAKIMDGNTMTSSADGGNYKGEVHENTSEIYHYSRLNLIERTTKDQLIPKMVRDGFPLDKSIFEYREHKDIDAEVDRIVKLSQAGYKVPIEYVNEVTGIEVEEVQPQQPAVKNSIMNEVKDLYSGFFDQDHTHE